MKTRNNQSNADETLLNQSITRRSFVKRGAVASAATVFGVALPTTVRADMHTTIVGHTYVDNRPGIRSGNGNTSIAAINAAIGGLGNAFVSPIEDTWNDYTQHVDDLNPATITIRNIPGQPLTGGAVGVIQNGDGTWTATILGPTIYDVRTKVVVNNTP